MKIWPTLALIGVLAVSANAQESRSTSSIAELERKLDQAVRDVKTLSGTIESLRSELDSLMQVRLQASDWGGAAPGNARGQTPPEHHHLRTMGRNRRVSSHGAPAPKMT